MTPASGSDSDRDGRDDGPLQPEVLERPPGGTPSLQPGASGTAGPGGGSDDDRKEGESIEQPAKLLRIGSMVKQLLDEVRQAPLDEASRSRLREIYEQSIRELAEGLSPDLVAELDRVSIPFDSPTPSEAELRVAHAQLVGWLEGLFHGIQATLVAQQVAARAQLDEMRQRSLPPGAGAAPDLGRPGTYL
ncbi:MAG TPA: bacterial proteasome activator family protein [Acidimicrobiales bacterium]|nr:bacterial proteasome activator family protein [Acidimicrobiales bacterium]